MLPFAFLQGYKYYIYVIQQDTHSLVVIYILLNTLTHLVYLYGCLSIDPRLSNLSCKISCCYVNHDYCWIESNYFCSERQQHYSSLRPSFIYFTFFEKQNDRINKEKIWIKCVFILLIFIFCQLQQYVIASVALK